MTTATNTTVRTFATISLDEARTHLYDLDEVAGVIPRTTASRSNATLTRCAGQPLRSP